MVRSLYRSLMRMHPPAFRRRFAAEMLCIFDEAASLAGAPALLLDALASLARQWIVRSGLWKLAVALVGACLQLTAGGVIWIAIQHGGSHAGAPSLRSLELDRLMQMIAIAVGGIVLLVASASIWMASFARKRSHG